VSWPVTRTLIVLAFALDLFFSALVAIGFLYLIGINRGPERRLVLALIAPPSLLKSVAILFIFHPMLRPIDQWIRAEGTPAETDQLILRAAHAVYTAGDRFSRIYALLWGLMYPCIAATLAMLHPAGISIGWAMVVATLLVSISVFSAASVLSRTITGALLFSTAGRISLAARVRALPLPARGVSLPTRLALLVVFVAIAPTAWMCSLAYTVLHRAGGSVLVIVFFAIVSVVWIPLSALFVAGAVARPLARIANVVASIYSQQDATKVERIPIYSRDDIGHLTEGVNHMVDRLADSAEEELALDRFKDQFIRVAAHELNTPVAIVKAYGEVLVDSSEALPPSRRNLPAALLRGAERMERIVQELLSISELQLGRMPFAKERLDLRQTVDRAVAAVAPTARRHRLRVAGDPVVAVEGDATRLEKVVRNLLDNAIKYSPGGGEVDVIVRQEGNRAVVSIRDQGVGIPLARQARIFECFYRAHTDTPYDRGGLGVGLYLSREFVGRHGGRIWFESEEGKGSTFYFSVNRSLE